MKKDIRFVSLDPPLIQWLCRALRSDAPEISGRRDLLEGLEELTRGSVSALMLETGMEEGLLLPKDTIVCGEITVFPRLRKVTRADREVPLTPKEFDILYFLIRNRGEVFTKEQIYRAVWSEDYILDDSNIMAFIRKLRKKIEPDPDEPKYILTIWGIGYKFNDRV